MGNTRRSLALTQELVMAIDRVVPDTGPEPGYEPTSDSEFAEASQRIVDELAGDTLRVFAYGSLIWRPEFEHTGHQIARLAGYRRSFCIDMQSYRGSPDQPGLMMALDVGGSCEGIVYDLPPDDHRSQIERLLRREVPYREDLSFVHWVDVRTADGPRRALTFYASPRSANYFIELPLEEQAQRIALAAGHVGTNAAYLHNTVVKLMEHGIHDSYLWRLQQMVADEILDMLPQLRS